MAVGEMIFPFLLYLLLLLLPSLLHLLRNDRLVCELLLLRLFVVEVVEEGDGSGVEEKRGVEYRCP